MKAIIILADAAQAVGGKLYILGGGWSVTGPDPVAGAVAVKLDVPWDVADLEHPFRIELVDADGHLVVHDTPAGPQQMLVIEGDFKTGRPDDLKPGTAVDGALAFGFAGMPVPPGGRYEFRLWIDGETTADWSLPFTTRPEAEEQAA